MRTGRAYGQMDKDMNQNDQKSKIRKNKIMPKHIITMLFWMIIAIFIIYQSVKLVRYTIGKEDKENMWLYNSVNSIMKIFVKNTNKETTEEYSLKFAGLGDIYVTNTMINSAKNGTSYDFSQGIDKIKEKLESFDVVVASLDTPVSDKSLGYSSKSIYNAPVELLDTLKQLKISAVATATAHAMDKNVDGINATIENLKNASIEQVGINSNSEKNKPIVISKNEIKLGILSYTTKSNIKLSKNQTYLVNILDESEVKSDVEYLKSQNVDYIIAYLNDPNENSLLTSGSQKQNVEMLFNNGINVVLGTGSMVVQGQVEDQIQINDDTTNHIYSIYSLGDFFGNYTTSDNKSSVIANIEFTKKVKKNKKGEVEDTVIDMKVNTPIFLWTTLSTNNIKTMYIMQDEISAYNNDNSKITQKEYKDITNANERLKELFK